MEALNTHRTIRQPLRLVVHYSQSIEQARQQYWGVVAEASAPSALRQQRRYGGANSGPFGPQVFRTGPPDNSPARETRQGNHHLPTAGTVRQPRMCHESLDTNLNLPDRRNGQKWEGLRQRIKFAPVGAGIGDESAL